MALRRPFYGWLVVLAVFVMLATSAGLGFYALTLYLETLTVERGFAVSSVSGATAVFFLATGASGVAVGRQMARRDPRPVIAGGAFVAAGAIVALGSVSELWQVYVTYAVLGVGFACTALVPATTLVTRWFHRRRAVALSVASTGLSAGGIFLTPFAARLIDRVGLADATPVIALGFVLGVVPITALFVRADPSRLGLRPDGDVVAEGSAVPAPAGVAYAVAVRSRLFWAITAAWSCCLLAQVGGIAHLFNLVSRRVDRPTAALAVSVMAALSLTGRLVGGWVLTRVRLRSFTLGVLVLQASGLVLLALATSRVPLLAAAGVFGSAMGNVLLLQPVVLAEVFGVADYPRIFARSQLVSTVGTAAGPFLVGVVYDVASGYRAAYLVAALLSLVGVGLLASGGPLESPGDRRPPEAVPAV